MPVRVLEPIRDEVVTGFFRDKTPEEMMRTFGEMTLTSWSIQQGTVVVAPDGRARAEAEKQELKERTAMYQKNIDRLFRLDFTAANLEKSMREAVDLQKNVQEGNYDYEKIQALDQLSPGNRLAAIFLRSVGAAELAKATDEERIVYTMNPTQYQTGLGNVGRQMLEEGKRMMALHQETLGRVVPGDNDQSGYHMNLLQRPWNQGVPEDVKVTVTKQSQYATVQVELLGEKGMQLLHGYASVSGSYDAAAYEEYRQPDGSVKFPPGPFHDSDAKFAVDPRSRRFGGAIYRQPGTPERTDEETKSLMAVFRDILTDEPLGWTPSNMFETIAKTTGKDVGGRVDDRLIFLGTVTMEPGGKVSDELTVSSAMQIFGYVRQKLVTIDDERVTLGASTDQTEYRMNRRLMALLADEWLKKGALSFDKLAEAALASESRESFQMALQLFEQIISNQSNYVTESYSEGMSTDKYSALRIYGSLPKPMRERMKRETVRVSASELPSKAREELLKVLLREQNSVRSAGMMWDSEVEPTEEVRQRAQELQQKYGMKLYESTYVLALPEASPVVVELSIGKRERLYGHSGGEYGMVRGSIENLAQRAAMAHYAEQQGVNQEYYRPIKEFSSQILDLLSIKVLLGQDFTGGVECEISNSPMTAKFGMDKMPTAMRSKYESALARYIEMYKGIQFGGEGAARAVPPAP